MKTGTQLVTDIMGTKIKNPTGEEVGVIQNVMITPQDGAITYIVLCYANFIGKINRHFAIPRRCLEIKNPDTFSFYFEIDEEILLSAAGFIPTGTSHSTECVYELLQGTTDFIPKYFN
ncbi:PRC-barrel domain-containing protein [Aliifodinibius salicampi]|uniref:PRC-barrel domain-containing protein n=1 Tax=Fodinibius salicampi TaxID=1920655 RepID=A0ABT3PXM9_9BACT|nr:PRC-barrel domain-containing protein [Fodinibius salicampi]MCW9712593.1 PRC-barrel domain-containing protein [Fodinibius salicampi]